MQITCLVLLSLILPVSSAYAQSQQPAAPCTSIDYEAVLVVEGLWNSASSGELLNPEGWARATSARYFTDPASTPKESGFRVVNNRYWITNISHEDGKLLIPVETEELGRIDSALRFIPTRHENPDFYAYRMVYGATPSGMWTSDGKKLTKQTVTMTGPNQWRIEGSLTYRWATVNATIIHIQDMRDKSKDPMLRGNAEKTLKTLRQFR
jgi:hypothetical protein